MDLDKEEFEILEAYEKGEFKPVENSEAEMKIIKEAACNYSNKNKIGHCEERSDEAIPRLKFKPRDIS